MLFKLLMLLLGCDADIRLSMPLSYRKLNRTTFDIHSKRARRLVNEAPLRGDLALGYYFAYIWLGSNHQRASVILDTGSSLTALPCVGCPNCGSHSNPPFDPSQSNTSSSVLCSDEICSSLDAMRCTRGKCGYSQSYSENSALHGHYIRDQLWFSTGSTWNAADSWGGISYAIGCHESETNLFQTQTADGIMGLSGTGKTLTTELIANRVISKNILALCIAANGGTFSVGGYDDSRHIAPAVWTSLTLKSGRYCVSLSTINVGQVTIGSEHEFNSGYGCVLDSGTTYTYLPTGPFHEVIGSIKRQCDGCAQEDNFPREEHTCFTIPLNKSPEDVFPSLTFTMNDNINFMVSPLQYLTRYNRLFCVSLYDNGRTSTVLGANILQNYDMIIDLEDHKVGFAKAVCEFFDENPSTSVSVLNGSSSSTHASSSSSYAPSPRSKNTPSVSSLAPLTPVRPSSSGSSANSANADKSALPVGPIFIGGVVALMAVIICFLCVWIHKRRRESFEAIGTRGHATEMEGLVPPLTIEALEEDLDDDSDIELEEEEPVVTRFASVSPLPSSPGTLRPSSPLALPPLLDAPLGDETPIPNAETVRVEVRPD